MAVGDFIAFGTACLLTAVLVFPSIAIARRSGALALVTGNRWHTSGAIPRLGGPAILFALFPWFELQLWLVLAAFCLIGVWDDHRPLRPAHKGLLLLIPSALAAWVTGVAWVGAACWLASNALNMLDHADGIATSSCLGSLIVLGGDIGPSAAGASAGFLVHNWPPAKSFLGDGGSLMLGALLVLAWSPHGVFATLAGIAIPVLDMAFVLIRRFRERRKPWLGGTDHSGHALLRAGTPRMALPLLYGCAAAVFATIGIHSL